jgi:hypothetical protein
MAAVWGVVRRGGKSERDSEGVRRVGSEHGRTAEAMLFVRARKRRVGLLVGRVSQLQPRDRGRTRGGNHIKGRRDSWRGLHT